MTLPTTTAPDLFTVRQHEKYLQICERTLRELFAFEKITYRPTGGMEIGRINFTYGNPDIHLLFTTAPGVKKQTRRGH